MELTNDFGQFLSSQWNTGKFSADSAEPSTQDPLSFFAVGRDVLVRIEKGCHRNPKLLLMRYVNALKIQKE